MIMTNLGKVIWEECGKKAIDEGAVKVLEYICEQRLPMGAKTFTRRLTDGNWTARELSAIQVWLKSEKIANAINEEFHLIPSNGKRHDKSR